MQYLENFSSFLTEVYQQACQPLKVTGFVETLLIFSPPRGSFEQIATKCKINKKTPTYFDNSSTSNSILLPRGKVINLAGFQNLFCPQCITFQSSKRLLNLKCITSIAKRQKHSQGARENLVNIFIGLKVDFQKLHSTYDCLFFYVKSCTAFLMDYYLIDLNFTT